MRGAARATLALIAAASCAGALAAQDMGTAPPPGASSAAPSSSGSKKSSEPFYRRYLVAGNPLDDQIVEQEKRITETPGDAGLHNDFGNLLAKRRFPKEAAEQYEIAAKLDKNNFISYYNLGLLRETEGKVDAAISAYEKSIKRKPGFPPSRFRLGRLFERIGRSEDAIAEYSQAFLTDPSMRDPKRNPLVIDSELIYRASLTNYQRDVATAVENDAMWVEESRFHKVPVDRSVAAEEVEPGEPADAAPREVGPAGASAATPDGAHPRRGRPPVAGESGTVGGPQQRTAPARPTRMNRGARPTPAPAPPPEMVPAPEEAPSQPEPEQDPNNPETMPEQPQPPEEVEPS